jgi:hypothetical protein
VGEEEEAAAPPAASARSFPVSSSSSSYSTSAGPAKFSSKKYLLKYNEERYARRQRLIELVQDGRVDALSCLRIERGEAEELGLSPDWPYFHAVEEELEEDEGEVPAGSLQGSRAASGAAGLAHTDPAGLAHTDPMTLCKKIMAGKPLSTTAAGSARKAWELSVETSIVHLPVLHSNSALPDKTFLC